MQNSVLGIFAHPDDAEIFCAGTMALLKKAGWKIHIATMTPGDKGSADLTRKEISKIRKDEASKSAELLEASYHCLDFDDIYIFYDRETINKATSLIRQLQPRIVFTASQTDYMKDHELTGKIVQTACFAAGIKNMEISDEPTGFIPHLFYCDPMEGKDIAGNNIFPSVYVDISSTIEIKEKMLACHESQRSWLLLHHKMDEYILSMRRFAEKRGNEIGVKYAEGFTQHLGHGYPQDNILYSTLNEVVLKPKE